MLRAAIALAVLLTFDCATAYDGARAQRPYSVDSRDPESDHVILRSFDVQGKVSDETVKPPGSAAQIPLSMLHGPRAGCVSIDLYGGAGDATTDNGPSLRRVVASFPANGGCVQLGTGTYLFASPYAQTFPNGRYGLTIRGTGPDSTRILFPRGDGFAFNYQSAFNSLHISELAVLTGSASPNSTGIALTQSFELGNFTTSTFQRLNFSGLDGGGGRQYWGKSIDNNGVSGVNYSDISIWGGNDLSSTGADKRDFLGSGLVIRGDAAHVIVQNVRGSNFFSLSKGLVYGSRAEGLTVSSSNFTNGNYGIYTSGYANQLSVFGSQFNVLKEQIRLGDQADLTSIQHNAFILLPDSIGVSGGRSVQLDVSHNSFTAVGKNVNGVVIANSPVVSSSTINGNQFVGTVTAVILDKTSRNVTVSGNSFANVVAKVFDQGMGNTVTTENAGIVQHLGDLAVGGRFFGLGDTSPTISACGSRSGILSPGASDISGSVTLMSNATTCTVNFARRRAYAPDCTVSSRNGKPPSYSTQPEALLLVPVNPATGDIFTYVCAGQ